MSARYEPLKTVVAYFSDEEDKSEGDQDKHWLLGFRALSLMHYNITAEPKTLRLPVNSNQTVYFPPDCVTWVKIGIETNGGGFSVLKINNGLTTFKDLNPSRIDGLTPDITDGWLTSGSPFLNYWNNGSCQTMFGVGQAGVATYGECRVDEKNNVVILSPNFNYSSILFEYISSPEKDSDYLVDVRLREAIIAFIKWKTKTGTRQEFYGAFLESRRMINPLRMQTFQQAIRENERFTLKT